MDETTPVSDYTRLRVVPWSNTVSIRLTPLCPSCAHELQPVATRYFLGLAACYNCCVYYAHELAAAYRWLAQPHARKHTTWKHGLIFYTPRHHSMISARQLCQWTTPEYAWLCDPIDCVQLTLHADIPDYNVV